MKRLSIIAIRAVAIVHVLVTNVAAEPYKIGIGDQIIVSHSGDTDFNQLGVDADGELRLAIIGGVHVAGLSLDQAEAAIAQELTDQGFLVDPLVNLRVQTYAPVIVGGDVMRPGQFPFVPGMTVAAALALSGGQQENALSETDETRARAEAKAALLTANLDIAMAAARLARHEAELNGLDTAMSLSPESRQRVPLADAADLAAILRKEADVLESERARARQLVSFWKDEIATIEAQSRNFDARIAVQQEIVASTLANLEASKELSERGLQTAARLSVAEQRAADARARVLELEAAKIAAAQAISTAQRERVVFLANRKRDALLGVQEMTRDLETATYRYQRANGHLAALAGMATHGIMDPNAVKVEFHLQTSRKGRPSGDRLGPETLLLPGEVLIVNVVPLTKDLDG